MKMSKKTERVTIQILEALFFTIISLTILSYAAGDSDYYWHYKLGEYIVKNKKMLTTDVFSWWGREQQLMTMNHSWLSSILIYLCGTINQANCAFGRFIFVGCTAFIFYYCLEITFFKEVFRKINLDICDFGYHLFHLSVITMMCIFKLFIVARPLDVGYICFLLAFYCIYRSTKTTVYKARDYLVLPVISLAWANVHGGTVPMLMAFLGMYTVLFLLPDFSIGRLVHKRCTKAAKYMAVNLVTTFFAGMINPYGYHLFTYFFLQNNEATKSMIREWQPSKVSSLGILICLFVVFMFFVLVKEKIRLDYILPFLITFVMCGKYCRMEYYCIITAVFLICYMVSMLEGPVFECNRMKTERKEFNNTKMICWIVIFECLFILAGSTLIVKVRYNDRGVQLPDELVEYLKEARFERMYSNYEDGGLLIAEGLDSFIDARADLFEGEDIIDSINFRNAYSKKVGWIEDYIEKYNFDGIMLKKDSKTIVEILLSRDWIADYWYEEYIVMIPPFE